MLRSIPPVLLLGLIGTTLLTVGCDTTGGEPDMPPTIDRVKFTFVPEDGQFVRQIATARRSGPDTFQVDGRLVLEPGTYRVGIEAFEEDESVTTYVADGTDIPLLRYALSGGLDGHLSPQQGPAPRLVPLDTVLAPLGRAQAQDAPAPKTTPVPRPQFLVRVADTSGTTGTLRLVLERYESFTAYRKGSDPRRVDFDLRHPIRTVPTAER
jgi:hypothetical protein